MSETFGPARQRGGFVIGLVVGLLFGLAVALGVALYVTKAPNPFVNKVPVRPAGQDAVDAERSRTWDPNGALAGRNPAPRPSASSPGFGDPVLPAVGSAPVVAARPSLVPPTVIDPVLPGASSASRPPRSAAASAASAATVAAAAATHTSPLPGVAGTSPFSYFVQAGAYSRSEDAEQQRARLALLGVESRLTEREQGGRMVYRVRVGPFERREDAEGTKDRLGDSGVDSALVAVQK
ncbi:MAG: SPOR domain-containing protein [Caldimonas sp.]